MCDTKFSIYLYSVRLESVNVQVVMYPLGFPQQQLTDVQHSLANSKYEKVKGVIEEGLPQRVGFF